MWLIVGREEELKVAKEENEQVKKAMEIIKEMSMDPKEWELYESRRLAIMDYNTGMHQARIDGEEERNKETVKKSGKKENQIEIAKELIKYGMKIEDIMKITKLSKKEIEQLK